jgi:hypothetical protein
MHSVLGKMQYSHPVKNHRLFFVKKSTSLKDNIPATPVWCKLARGAFMKKLLTVLLLAAPSLGARAGDKIAALVSTSQVAQLNEANLQTHQHHFNSDGQVLYSPTATKFEQAPAGAST